MHEVHTYRRAGEPITRARMRLTFRVPRRFVRRCECDTDMPHDGRFPHTSHTAAIWTRLSDRAVPNEPTRIDGRSYQRRQGNDQPPSGSGTPARSIRPMVTGR